MPYLDQSSGRDGRLDDKRNHDYGRCRSQLRDLQVRHQGYGHLGGQRLGEQGLCDIISFTDMSDPITVDLVSQKGFTIKNNGNDVDAKAVLYRGGEEIDTGGTAYTYTWKLWNSAGTSVVKTYTGKSITVSKADVTGKGVLMCEVSK